MKARAVVRLKLPSQKHLLVTSAVLSPEAYRPSTKRASVTIEKEGDFLILKVEAESTIALRSTLNAYLRWISSTANVLEVLDENSVPVA